MNRFLLCPCPVCYGFKTTPSVQTNPPLSPCLTCYGVGYVYVTIHPWQEEPLEARAALEKDAQ